MEERSHALAEYETKRRPPFSETGNLNEFTAAFNSEFFNPDLHAKRTSTDKVPWDNVKRPPRLGNEVVSSFLVKGSRGTIIP